MSTRRMFSLKVVDTDDFLDMGQESQLLYFHLAMRADDDGFVNSPKKIMRFAGAKDDALKVLVAKQFIIPFQSGVIVIKHWKENNQIRKDRKQNTIYQEELAQLSEDCNGHYELQPSDNQMSTKCQHSIGKYRLGEDRIGEVSIVENNINSYGIKDKELTELLYSKIKENYSFVKDKTEKQKIKDYEEMNRIFRLDGRTYEQIEFIINFSQEDSFWKQNIRSVSKLRKQFEALAVKAKDTYQTRRVVEV